MEFLPPHIQEYAEHHTSAEPPVLNSLTSETKLKAALPEMLSGHLQGRFLALLSKLIRPQHVLEIGTYTGYSAICFAEGLKPSGMVHSIDTDPAVQEIARNFITKAGMQKKIKLYTGKALEIIPTFKFKFDIVFIDADKGAYPSYFEMVSPRVK